MKEKSRIEQNETAKGRRKATKTILVGGGIVGGLSSADGKWVKPLFKESILPAHANLTELEPGSW